MLKLPPGVYLAFLGPTTTYQIMNGHEFLHARYPSGVERCSIDDVPVSPVMYRLVMLRIRRRASTYVLAHYCNKPGRYRPLNQAGARKMLCRPAPRLLTMGGSSRRRHSNV